MKTSVTSLRQLRRLKVRLKPDDSVQIHRIGSHYKARFKGGANCVFGTTAQEAKQRLLSVDAKKRGIIPTPITDFEKQLLESCR